jgi:hypothetical protein
MCDDGVEAAFNAARLAHDAVEKAHDESASLARPIQKFAGAITAAAKLLELAKGVKSG